MHYRSLVTAPRLFRLQCIRSTSHNHTSSPSKTSHHRVLQRCGVLWRRFPFFFTYSSGTCFVWINALPIVLCIYGNELSNAEKWQPNSYIPVPWVCIPKEGHRSGTDWHFSLAKLFCWSVGEQAHFAPHQDFTFRVYVLEERYYQWVHQEDRPCEENLSNFRETMRKATKLVCTRDRPIQVDESYFRADENIESEDFWTVKNDQ